MSAHHLPLLHPTSFLTSSDHERRGREPVSFLSFDLRRNSDPEQQQLAAAARTGQPLLGHEHTQQRRRATAGAVGPLGQCMEGKGRRRSRQTSSAARPCPSRAARPRKGVQCERGQGLLEKEYVTAVSCAVSITAKLQAGHLAFAISCELKLTCYPGYLESVGGTQPSNHASAVSNGADSTSIDQPSVYHKVQGDSVAKRSSGAWGSRGTSSSVSA